MLARKIAVVFGATAFALGATMLGSSAFAASAGADVDVDTGIVDAGGSVNANT
jgi:hypothetical protein